MSQIWATCKGRVTVLMEHFVDGLVSGRVHAWSVCAMYVCLQSWLGKSMLIVALLGGLISLSGGSVGLGGCSLLGVP